jgi:formate/nitrite transporter FocA (FNT family)
MSKITQKEKELETNLIAMRGDISDLQRKAFRGYYTITERNTDWFGLIFVLLCYSSLTMCVAIPLYAIRIGTEKLWGIMDWIALSNFTLGMIFIIYCYGIHLILKEDFKTTTIKSIKLERES